MPSTNGKDERPITLKDLKEALAEVETRLQYRVTEAEARIEDRIVKGVVAGIEERMQDLETRLLTEFHGYGGRSTCG